MFMSPQLLETKALRLDAQFTAFRCDIYINIMLRIHAVVESFLLIRMHLFQRKREQENFDRLQKKEQQKLPVEDAIISSDIFNFPRSKVEQLLSQSQALVDEANQQQQTGTMATSASTSTNIKSDEAASKVIEIGSEEQLKVQFHQQRMPAYQGKQFTEEEIRTALYEMDPWITFEKFDSEEELIQDAAQSLNDGKVFILLLLFEFKKRTYITFIFHFQVIAWFQGRSEFGQRALGSRLEIEIDFHALNHFITEFLM